MVSLRNLFAAGFLILAGLCNGTMDSLQFHYPATVFSNPKRFDQRFWNPSESWKNKYRNGDVKQGEAFPFSSTALVFTTDGWHLFKFLMLKFFLLAVVVCQPMSRRLGHEGWQVWAGNSAAFVVAHLCFQLGFKIAYV